MPVDTVQSVIGGSETAFQYSFVESYTSHEYTTEQSPYV